MHEEKSEYGRTRTQLEITSFEHGSSCYVQTNTHYRAPIFHLGNRLVVFELDA